MIQPRPLHDAKGANTERKLAMHMNNDIGKPTLPFSFVLRKTESANPRNAIPDKPARAMTKQGRWTEEKVSIAKAMRDRGDRQHDIAAWFGVNGGRVGEMDEKWPGVGAFKGKLPPRGPYDIPGLFAALDTAHRRMVSAANDIVEISAEIEKQLPPDSRMIIGFLLTKLLRCAEKLEQRH